MKSLSWHERYAPPRCLSAKSLTTVVRTCKECDKEAAPSSTFCARHLRESTARYRAETAHALDCQACKTPGSMKSTNVAKRSSFIQAIGLLLLPSSVLAMLVAIAVTVFGLLFYGRIILVRSGLIVLIVSLVGSLVGRLALGSKNVYKCARCGLILKTA